MRNFQSIVPANQTVAEMEYFDIPEEFDPVSREERLDAFLNFEELEVDRYAMFFAPLCNVMEGATASVEKVFRELALRAEVDKGRVIIQSELLEIILKKNKMAKSTFYRSIDFLKEKNAIKQVGRTYYFNPFMTWRGSNRKRAEFFKIYHELL
jgi:hypothetical protein